MTFPADIKNVMKECVLKLFWAKDDIVAFFTNNGCTTKDIASLNNFKEMSRAKIVSTMFDHLSAKADNGLGQFRSMLQSLISWSHFDSYYFDKLKKLNREDAQISIEHLKQLQEIRDHKILEERKKREEQDKKTQSPKKTLQQLKKSHISLIQGELPTNKRGYELEKILLELSKLSGLEVTEPFRVNGEQIDGSIKFDGEHYLVEAK